MDSDNSYIIQLVSDLGPWAWLIGGIILLALELAMPGSFLVWLGLAALVVGMASFVVDLSWQVAWIGFAVLAIVFLLIGRRVFSAERTASDRPHLNERGRALVGRRFTLTEPIVDGEGRVRIGDTLWRVRGPNLAAGTSIEVRSADSATLIVAPVAEAPSSSN
jgi:membrane protein implicated in regulation of membrane protease activity